MSTALRVGVIGTGFGKHHIRALTAHPRAEVAAVCSTDITRASKEAQDAGIPLAYADYKKMLDEAPIDAVCISTHPVMHAEISLAAFESGKHVLCTKPLADTLTAAGELRDVARNSGLVHAIDQNLRFAPPTLYAKSLIDSGAIGRPLSVLSSMYLSPAAYFSNQQASPNKNSWFASRERGGGFLLANAPHEFDRLLWYFGTVKSVQGWAWTAMPSVKTPDGSIYECDADDAYQAIFEFQSGLRGVVMFNPVGWSTMQRRLEVHGEDGSIFLEGPSWDKSIKVGDRSELGLREVDVPEEYLQRALPEGVSPGMFELMDRFVQATLDGATMSPSFDDGVKTQELIEAVVRSGSSGTKQALPLI